MTVTQEESEGQIVTAGVDLSQERTRWTAGTLIRRVLWGVVWTLFFRMSPRPKFDFWRAFLLRMFGAKVGKKVIISNTVKVLYPWNLEIGDNSWVGWHVDIYNYAPVKIGSNSVVSQYSYLCTGTHDYTKRGFPLTWAPITVGDHVWVAAVCFLAPGVTIGNGSIIASRSVVTKDMPEWKICAGHPCQPIKDRPPVTD